MTWSVRMHQKRDVIVPIQASFIDRVLARLNSNYPHILRYSGEMGVARYCWSVVVLLSVMM